MSIDEAIENLQAIQAYYNDEMQDGYIGFAKEDNESVDLVMNTMHKYQKIQEIMAKRPKDMISSNPTLRAISEVLEDEY